MVYCNKVLFKLKQDDLKPIGDKISNKKILKMIENKKIKK